MKNRFLCLCLAGALLLGLTSCSAAEEPVGTAVVEEPVGTAVPGGPQSSPTPTPKPTPTPEPFAVQAADVPPGDYQPWQEGYAAFLTELRQKEGELRNWVKNATGKELDEASERANASANTSESYCLYDVDKDGIPELFVKYGDCEADYYSVCYTFRDGLVAAIGDFPSGHSSLYTWPGENAVIYSWGHMGTGEMEKLSIQDGQLVFTEDLYQEAEWNEESLDYTDPALFVPGSEYIPSYYTGNLWRPPETPAQLLPIYDYGALPREKSDPMEEAEVRAAIGKVLWEGEPFFGVSGNGHYGDTGWTTFEEYRTSEGADPYVDAWLVPLHYSFTDVNGDGQEDCIVKLTDKISYMDLDGDGQVERVIMNFDQTVFSVQDGTVYAYFFSYPMDAVVLPDGTFYFSPWYKEYSISVRFFGNQCYTLYEPLVEGDDLAWEPFPSEPPTP